MQSCFVVRGPVVGLVVAACLIAPGPVLGQPSDGVAGSASASVRQLDDRDVQGISDLVRLIVLNNLPHAYENTKNWGGTKEVWAGLDISREGLRIETRRRTRQVNHGSWKKYYAWLIDPERQLAVRVENAGTIPGRGIGFDLVVESRLMASGRWSEWSNGVQLFSVSADAEAHVRLRVRAVVGLSFESSRFPPDLVLEPAVVDATLELIDFDLHRISKLGGPLAHELGRALRNVLEDELNDRRARLVNRMNGQIEKHRDKLRISPRELLQKGIDRLWASAAAQVRARQ